MSIELARARVVVARAALAEAEAWLEAAEARRVVAVDAVEIAEMAAVEAYAEAERRHKAYEALLAAAGEI